MHRVQPIEFALKRLLQEAPPSFLYLVVLIFPQCYPASEPTRTRCLRRVHPTKGNLVCLLRSIRTS